MLFYFFVYICFRGDNCTVTNIKFILTFDNIKMEYKGK